MRLCISIASILFVTTSAVAATITVRPETPDRPIVVVVEGSLAAFDEDQFAAKTAPLSTAFVAFSSDGGSLVAGLRIGEAIRRKRFSTIVPDGRRCASACALAWLGGVERFIGTSGKISFHAAYDAASDESGVGTAVVDAYLSKIGLPYEAVIYITQTASNEMTWLNMSDAAQRGIRVTLLRVLIVGCSHPTIEKIVEAASTLNKPIYLVLGGTHLLPATNDQISSIAASLHDKWSIRYIAPVHCTGEPAFAILKETFGDHYVYAGLSTTVLLGPKVTVKAEAGQPDKKVMDEEDFRTYRQTMMQGPFRALLGGGNKRLVQVDQ